MSKQRHHMREPSPDVPMPPRVVSILMLVVLGGILVLGVLTRSVVAALVASDPETASTLAPSSPELAFFRADQVLQVLQANAGNSRPGDTPDQANDGVASVTVGVAPAESKHAPDAQTTDVTEIQSRVRSALINEPLAARGFTILGFLAEAKGQHEIADRYMQTAAARSHREVSAVYWAFRRSFEANNFAKALEFADALLRKKAAMMEVAAPLLGRMTESPDGFGPVVKLLGKEPPWRERFFGSLNGNITDARTPLKLLLALKDGAKPPTKSELNAYFSFLFGHGFHELAYSSWLQFLTSEQLAQAAHVNNGSFESEISEMPFDWNIPRQTGALVEIASRDDAAREKALTIEFAGGRVDFQPVWQTTMLPPGTYNFSGYMKGDLKGKRGLVWKFNCLGKTPALVGEGDMALGSIPAWAPFQFEVKIPESGCRAQKLSLSLASRSASETMVFGKMWFDDLRMSRMGMVTPVQ